MLAYQIVFCLVFFSFNNGSCSELSLYKINMWQSKDRDGTTLPYFSKTFLDQLTSWNIKDWQVFIWGAGDCPTESTLFWFARHAASVVYVDWNEDWILQLSHFLKKIKVDNVEFRCRAIENITVTDSLFGVVKRNTLSDYGEDSSYVKAITESDKCYDCIIVDGHHRNTCIEQAVKYVRPGGVIIFNNANQKTIGINSERTYRLLEKYLHYSFLHPDHIDWRTDYWIID